MLPDAYNDWISIYNDEIKVKWESERLELRKILMIYCAFNNEVNKLKDQLDCKIEELKCDLKRKDYLQKSKNFVGLVESQWFDGKPDVDKENENPEQVPLKESCDKIVPESETPDIVPLKEISQNEIVMLESETPYIVPLKKANCHEIKTSKFIIETPNTSTFLENPTSPPLIMKKDNSPKLNNKRESSLDFSEILCPIVSHKVGKVQKPTEKTLFHFLTPKTADDSNIMECSIVEDTPDRKPSKRNRSSKLSLSKKMKLNENKQKNTLTQMLSEPRKIKKRVIDSNGPSMTIDAMLDLINDSSGSETDEDLDKVAHQRGTNVDNDKIPFRLNKNVDNLHNQLTDLKSFAENYNKVPEKKDDAPQYVYNEVVRGKARKNLKGWACAECEDYYRGLNLPPEELQEKKNQCSKHRHRFNVREETFKGFWDLTFGPTPPM